MYCNRCASYICACRLNTGLGNQIGLADAFGITNMQSAQQHVMAKLMMEHYGASQKVVEDHNKKKSNKKLLLLRK
jgi:hypothetical protein